jgi:hypothetical protein
MILLDKSKAIIGGPRNTIKRELAFLIDKFCQDVESHGFSYADAFDEVMEELEKIQMETEMGIEVTHPGDNSRTINMPTKTTKASSPAEKLLQETLNEIQSKKDKKKKKVKKQKGKKKDKKDKKD